MHPRIVALLRPSSRLLARTYSTAPSAPVGLLDDLSYRGFVQDVTTPQALHDALQAKPRVVYAGIDPTAPALHAGHLLPFMCLFHFHLHGHHIIPLIGGATALVGDPSGRATEREPAEEEKTHSSAESLTAAVSHFFARALEYAQSRIVLKPNRFIEIRPKNNAKWHREMTMMDFLRDVGVHARVNTMLNKESVRARLASPHGISFTEFSYQLLQAYDFHYLHRNFGCTVQIGGSDQWGNILAGIALIQRITAQNAPAKQIPKGPPPPIAFGLTTPLLTTAAGVKFGKSAGNAVWLDPELTSIFNFYQYFVRTADTEVEKHLKLLTLMSWQDINDTMEAHKLQPEQRIAQRRLASELTELVHTKAGLATAETLTRLTFDSDLSGVSASQVVNALEGSGIQVHKITRQELFEIPIAKLAVRCGLATSGAAARILILSRGLYYNNRPVPEVHFMLKDFHLLDNKIVILKAGKDKLAVLALEDA